MTWKHTPVQNEESVVLFLISTSLSTPFLQADLHIFLKCLNTRALKTILLFLLKLLSVLKPKHSYTVVSSFFLSINFLRHVWRPSVTFWPEIKKCSLALKLLIRLRYSRKLTKRCILYLLWKTKRQFPSTYELWLM